MMRILLVTGGAVPQVVGAVENITDTRSPLASDEVVNVLLLVPVFTPFTCHWYTGDVPGFTTVAVNVTELPRHTEVVGVLMDTNAGSLVTDMFIILLTALLGLAQGLKRYTFTWLLLVKVLDVNVGEFVPTLTPFTCQLY
jgi:hypothetical protein